MDPTIYYCYIDNETPVQFSIVKYPSISSFDLALEDSYQPKIKNFNSKIRSSYLKSENSLIFANLDAIFNFSQRSGGFISPQEAKQRLFYGNSIFSEGLDEYLRFRFQGADGMIVNTDIRDFHFKLHLLEVPSMGYDEMNEQLSESFGHGIDIYLADVSMQEIRLCMNHIRESGFALFIFNKELHNLTDLEFRTLLGGFENVSVFKPLILTGTEYFVCICSKIKTVYEPHDLTFELKNFNQMVHETFNEQNRINLFDSKKFLLSKVTTMWNLH